MVTTIRVKKRIITKNRRDFGIYYKGLKFPWTRVKVNDVHEHPRAEKIDNPGQVREPEE